MMDQYDLEDALLKMGVDRSTYSIGSLKEEALILLSEDRQWKVFNLERGRRLDERAFKTLDEACHYFLECVEFWRSRLNPSGN